MPKSEPVERVCANTKCGKTFLDEWGTQRYCDDICKKRQKFRERKEKTVNNRGGYNRKTYIQLWLDALNLSDATVGCHYCGEQVSVDTFVIDHVKPKAELKTRAEVQDIKNLTIACKSCNLRKGSMPAELYRQWVAYDKAREAEGT